MSRRAQNPIRDAPPAGIAPRVRRALVLLALVCGFAASAAGPTEYQVKAAFVFNFTRFIEWPARGFVSTNAPMIIGIVGENPFGKTLDDLTHGEVVRGHPLVVRRLQSAEDFRGCHVLYISSSEKDRLPTIFKQIKGLPVQTVGDVEGFTEQGGVVRFFIENKVVKMEINKTAADQAGLQISSKLLNLARVIKAK